MDADFDPDPVRPPASPVGPRFRIVFLFHRDLDLLSRTLPRCLEAFTAGTTESFEVVVHCDGTPADVGARLPALAAQWGVDEVRSRSRARFTASGDGSNNGHQRIMTAAVPYLLVIEDDVVAYRTERAFDPLAAIAACFERHPDVPVWSTVADSDQWSWGLRDRGAPVEEGVRSTNRLSTHCIAYDTQRFLPEATRFGAFERDVFIDRPDHSYNWEDLVTHVATTGGRRIAFADDWPLDVFHCDNKVADGSMYHTQDAATKAAILSELDARYAPEPAPIKEAP
jgi:hypothetical protein